jgi:hypothetical protein
MWRQIRQAIQQKRQQRYTIYTEHSPSRKADSSQLSEVFSGNFMEPERSVPCAQQPATLPHFEPDESSLCPPTVSLTHDPSYLFPTYRSSIKLYGLPAQQFSDSGSFKPEAATPNDWHNIASQRSLDLIFSVRGENYLQWIVSEFERWSGGLVKEWSRQMSAETGKLRERGMPVSR